MQSYPTQLSGSTTALAALGFTLPTLTATIAPLAEIVAHFCLTPTRFGLKPELRGFAT